MIADPGVTVIDRCGTMLEDGFEQFSQTVDGTAGVRIDVGASHRGNLRLAFDELTLDAKANDNLRLYTDAELTYELMRPIFHRDLPLVEPISIDNTVVYLLLVSDGANMHTSLRATVSCVCEDSPSFTDLDGDGYMPKGEHLRARDYDNRADDGDK
eukprot:COSAG06_NODE_12498_length_1373_cov_1.701727_3_plen_155_part_01